MGGKMKRCLMKSKQDRNRQLQVLRWTLMDTISSSPQDAACTTTSNTQTEAAVVSTIKATSPKSSATVPDHIAIPRTMSFQPGVPTSPLATAEKRGAQMDRRLPFIHCLVVQSHPTRSRFPRALKIPFHVLARQNLSPILESFCRPNTRQFGDVRGQLDDFLVCGLDVYVESYLGAMYEIFAEIGTVGVRRPVQRFHYMVAGGDGRLLPIDFQLDGVVRTDQLLIDCCVPGGVRQPARHPQVDHCGCHDGHCDCHDGDGLLGNHGA